MGGRKLPVSPMQPVFRAYLGSVAAGKNNTVKQMLKDKTVLKTEEITATAAGVLEFGHVRNCEAIEVLSWEQIVASLDAGNDAVNGVSITSAPMSYQIFQRNDKNEAVITIKGTVSEASTVNVDINGTKENVTVENHAFTYTKTLRTGFYDITVNSDKGTVAEYKEVGVGDTVISFAREIAASENVPVGIVQSSVGGTNIYQWVDGVRNDANSGYLFRALQSCFDKMPSKFYR